MTTKRTRTSRQDNTLAARIAPRLAELLGEHLATAPRPTPSQADLIRMAFNRLAAVSYHSEVGKLPPAALRAAARDLLNPAFTKADVLRLIAARRDVRQAPSQSAFYRFSLQFRWAVDSVQMGDSLGAALAYRQSERASVGEDADAVQTPPPKE
jgi:hypothetical protein